MQQLCPNCDSEYYHITPGYGGYCEDCGFSTDAKGRTIEDYEREKADSIKKESESHVE